MLQKDHHLHSLAGGTCTAFGVRVDDRLRGVDELTRAPRLLEGPLVDFIGSLPPAHPQRLCRSVFDRFSIRASGAGPKRVAEVTSYELTPPVQQALTECDHFVSNTPPRGKVGACPDRRRDGGRAEPLRPPAARSGPPDARANRRRLRPGPSFGWPVAPSLTLPRRDGGEDNDDFLEASVADASPFAR